ncbi:MAG: chromosome segregation protein ScpA [archaeon]|nr:chromosome segregation protein ScpA [archaeon]
MTDNAQMGELEQHLLYYKAMAEDEETLNKINGYLDILRNETNTEKLEDPFDESIREVFSLVLEKDLDPWAIDLESFVKVFRDRITSRRFDMLVAGRLLLMAWRVLHLQSASTRDRATVVVEEESFEDFEDFSDVDGNDDVARMFVPDLSLEVAYARDEPRSVSVVDLLEALQEAKREEEILQAREEARKKLENKGVNKKKFDNKAHQEDDEKVVEAVYQRICALGDQPMRISEFYTGDREEIISFFVSVLHLVRDGKLDIDQETLPYGEITIRLKQPETNVTTNPMEAE